jgi:hypothetical protein
MESPCGLDELIGEWSFEREVPGQARMSGTASFTRMDETTVVYREAGELQLEYGQRLQSRQSYLYEKTDDGFVVRFRDTGEIFHRVRLAADGSGAVSGSAEHLCKDDRYESQYWIDGDGSFEIRHRVRGPKKDYSIRTVYRRVHEAGMAC